MLLFPQVSLNKQISSESDEKKSPHIPKLLSLARLVITLDLKL